MNLKIIKCVFNLLAEMQRENSISYILKNPVDFEILEPCAYNLQSDVWAPWLIPKNLQVLEAFNILDMVFNNHVEHSFIHIEVGWSCLHFFLLVVLYYVIFYKFLPKNFYFFSYFFILLIYLFFFYLEIAFW